MKHKSAVVQEAEEIIQRYMKRQASLARRFQIKNKRKLPWGILLLLGIIIAGFFGVVLLLFW